MRETKFRSSGALWMIFAYAISRHDKKVTEKNMTYFVIFLTDLLLDPTPVLGASLGNEFNSSPILCT